MRTSTQRRREQGNITRHHENRSPIPGARGSPGRKIPGRVGGPDPGPGVPGTGDPKEEIHRWMTNLWFVEHQHDRPAVPRHGISAEQLLTGEPVLRFHGGPGGAGGAGQTAPEGGGAGQTVRSDECGAGHTARPGA